MADVKLVLGPKGSKPELKPLTLAERQESAQRAASPVPTMRDRLEQAAAAPLQSALVDALAETTNRTRAETLDWLSSKLE